MQKYGAEFFGTFWLVLGGCGSAVLAAAFPDVGNAPFGSFSRAFIHLVHRELALSTGSLLSKPV